MKICLLCGAESPVDAPTCPNDGEASWLQSVEMLEEEVMLQEVASEPRRGPGRPKKVVS